MHFWSLLLRESWHRSFHSNMEIPSEATFISNYHLHAWLLSPTGMTSSNCIIAICLIVTNVSLFLLVISASVSSKKWSYYLLIEAIHCFILTWQLCKCVLNNSKSSIPPLFSQFEVLTSTAGKVECYAWNVSSNSTQLKYPLEWRPYWVICTY